ncbi:hypothetical protein [Streptomyces sp. NPDC057301]|uniref:5'-methylthioadenosine/S-adenosylhomocysteine nucleosidase family protein n=1 Tax=Streptomyces sp. NPDC057301 TaxID=3346093 RepID=UPI003625348B
MAADARHPTAVILTALSLESSAVLPHLNNIERLVHTSGVQVDRGRLADTPWYIALAEIGERSTRAAVITERLNTWLQPEALFFVGIAGGLKEDIQVGDVVVATKVYGIQGGKETAEGFLVRPEAWRPSFRLEQAARHALRGKAHFKPIATSDVVIANAQSAITQHLHQHYNDAVAIEMEAAGVAEAAHLAGTLDALIIRGISDKADTNKHLEDAQGSQASAAENATAAVVAVLRNLQPSSAGYQAQIQATVRPIRVPKLKRQGGWRSWNERWVENTSQYRAVASAYGRIVNEYQAVCKQYGVGESFWPTEKKVGRELAAITGEGRWIIVIDNVRHLRNIGAAIFSIPGDGINPGTLPMSPTEETARDFVAGASAVITQLGLLSRNGPPR